MSARTKTKIRPFTTDLEFMEDYLSLLELRCRLLITRKRLKEASGKRPNPNPRRPYYNEEEDLDVLEPRSRDLKKKVDRAEKALQRRLDATRKQKDFTLSIDKICALYDLDEFERTTLLMAAAVVFSNQFIHLYGDFNENVPVLTVDTVFHYFELSFTDRIHRRKAFSSEGPLVKNDLITVEMHRRLTSPEELLEAQIRINNRTFALLIGETSILDQFMEFSSLEEPHSNFDQVVLDPADKNRILSVIERHDDYLHYRKEWGFDDVITYGRGVLMLFHGKPGTGKTMTAHAVAQKMGKRLLNVDIPTFMNHSEAERFLPALFREARIQNAMLFFDECEVLFASRGYGNTLMTTLLTELERFEGVAVLATNLPMLLDEALDRRILVKIRFPEPDREARRRIWEHHLPPQAPLADDIDLDELAERFEITGGYIKNAVLTAVAEAVHSGSDEPQISMQNLLDAARIQSRPILDEDSRALEPKTRLADVILPEPLKEQVQELIAAARHRRTILERWGIGDHLSYGKGVAALFYGDPGTGKTMCAESIAAELHRPLLVANVAALKSMFVGQTERNLSGLFREARAHNAVLFLDEADSLLMTRGAGHASRHDDSIVNVILSEIERHNGVVLLATNRKDSLDPALARRITYTLRFTAPGPDLRARIWERLLPPSVPRDALIDIEALARLPLTGALIKDAVFKAAFRAANQNQPLSTQLLLEAGRQLLPQGNAKAIGFGA